MTLREISSRHSAAVRDIIYGDGVIDDHPTLFERLFEYYLESGDMPYGTAKARDGDPYEWISDRMHGADRGELERGLSRI